MNSSILIQLQQQFPDIPFQESVTLAPYTYMKVGGPAEIFWEAKDRELFIYVVAWCLHMHLDFRVLGGASNVVIDDSGLSGLVILNRCDRVETLEPKAAQELVGTDFLERSLQEAGLENAEHLLLADSGIRTADVVKQSVQRGLAGLEPFLGVPGTLGGAIYNNSHYTHELIGTYVVAVEGVNARGDRQWWSHAECVFGYDTSRFHHVDDVIVRVLFGLSAGDRAHSMMQLQEATMKRGATQPLELPSSGCMFQNVTIPEEKRAEYDGKEKLSAGWLIDRAGLKGFQIGGARVSEKHANFIVNTGGATAADVAAVVLHVQNEVMAKYGIPLEKEVFFIGKQDDSQENA